MKALSTVTPPRLSSPPRLSIDEVDELTTVTTKLNALLRMTHGNAGEAFREMSDELQEEFLWACAGFANRAKALAYKLACDEEEVVHG